MLKILLFSIVGLLDHYPKDHTDFEDCLAARDRLGETLLEGLTVLNQAVITFLLLKNQFF